MERESLFLLVADEDKLQSTPTVQRAVYRNFDNVECSQVWVDPQEGRRAVALIHSVNSDGPTYCDNGQKQPILTWTDPAISIAVDTCNASSLKFGVQDKLKMLFTIKQRGGSRVKCCKALEQYATNFSFEVVFEDKWDAVFRACSQSWCVGGESIKVFPLFPCFRDNLDQQMPKLIKSELCLNRKTHVPQEREDTENTNKGFTFTSIQNNQLHGEIETVKKETKLFDTEEKLQPMEDKENNDNMSMPIQEAHLMLNDEHFDSDMFVYTDNAGDGDSPELLSILQINCRNLFLGWLLDKIICDEEFKANLEFDPDFRILIIRCHKSKENAWRLAVEAACLKGTEMSDLELDFFMQPQTKSLVEAGLGVCRLGLCQESEKPKLVIIEGGNKVPLEKWISNMICTMTVRSNGVELNEDIWKTLQDHHPLCNIAIFEGNFIIQTMSGPEAQQIISSAANDLQKMFQMVLFSSQYSESQVPSKATSRSSLLESTNDKLDNLPDKERKDEGPQRTNQPETHNLDNSKLIHRFIKWPREIVHLFKTYDTHIEEEITAIGVKYPPASLKLKPNENGILVEDAKNIEAIESELSKLRKKISNQTEDISIPGLQDFFGTKEGQHILTCVEKEFECVINTPDMQQISNSEDATPYAETETKESTEDSYSGVLLYSIIQTHFEVHLVEGQRQDIDADIAVDIVTSDDVHEAKLEETHEERIFNLLLPEWTAPKTLDCHKVFNSQRERLRETLSHTIHHALGHSSSRKTRLVISTRNLQKSELVCFPLLEIAEAFRDVLVSSTFTERLEVFIVEGAREAVVKSFLHEFKRCGLPFQTPSDSDWKKLVIEEQSISLPNYTYMNKNNGVSVTVEKTAPYYPHNTPALFCHSVLPSFENASFLTTYEEKDKFERNYISKCPDGLISGESLFISGRKNSTLVYACPAWSFGCVKILEKAIESCAHKWTGCQDVCFFPPVGFPVQVLARTVFTSLDRVLQKATKGMKLHLVVESGQHFQTFNDELKKRTHEKSWRKYFTDSVKDIFSSNKGGESSNSGGNLNQKKGSKTSRLNIVAFDSFRRNRASENLKTKLKAVLDGSKEHVKLDPHHIKDIASLEALINEHSGKVIVNFKKQQKKNNKKKKNAKKKVTPIYAELELTVSALTKVAKDRFLEDIVSKFGDNVFLKDSRFQEAGNGHQSARSQSNSSYHGNRDHHRQADVHNSQGDHYNKQQKGSGIDRSHVRDQSRQQMNTSSKQDNKENQIKKEENSSQTEESKCEHQNRPVGDHSSSEKIQRRQQEDHSRPQGIQSRPQASQSRDQDDQNKVWERKQEEDQSKLQGLCCNKGDQKTPYDYHTYANNDKSTTLDGTQRLDIVENKSCNIRLKLEVSNFEANPSGAIQKQPVKDKLSDTNSKLLNNTEECKDSPQAHIAESLHNTENCNESMKPRKDSTAACDISPHQFQWLFNHSDSNGSMKFIPCEKRQNDEIEALFREGKCGVVKLSYGQINLDTLTALGTTTEKIMIRKEIFDEQNMRRQNVPPHWCQTGFRTVPVTTRSHGNKYEHLTNKVQDGLKDYVRISKIEIVEAPELFRRSYCKKKQGLQFKDSAMWCRICPKAKAFVCEYGLHFNFMAKLKENNNFDRQPKCYLFDTVAHCLEATEVNGDEIILVETVVYTDEEMPYCSISSDAQAYPMHMITLSVAAR